MIESSCGPLRAVGDAGGRCGVFRLGCVDAIESGRLGPLISCNTL